MDDDLRRSATAGEHGVGGKGAGALGEHGPGHLVRPLDLPGGLCGGRAVMISRRGCSGRRSWERREGSGREDEERIRHDLTARLQWRRSRERRGEGSGWEDQERITPDHQIQYRERDLCNTIHQMKWGDTAII